MTTRPLRKDLLWRKNFCFWSELSSPHLLIEDANGSKLYLVPCGLHVQSLNFSRFS